MFTSLPDQLILFPTTNRIDPRGAERKSIAFQNGELEIWTARSRLAKERGGPEVYVLRFYGNADRADRWAAAEADMWNDRAIEVWGVNYPGFGGSTGPSRLKRIAPAALWCQYWRNAGTLYRGATARVGGRSHSPQPAST